MQLLWLHYKGKKNPRYILCLELGRKNGKIYSIETNKIGPGLRQKILSSRKILDSLSLDRKIEWLRYHCPQVMSGFKTLTESKANVVDTYPLQEITGRKNGK